jgi:hypothetical protein
VYKRPKDLPCGEEAKFGSKYCLCHKSRGETADRKAAEAAAKAAKEAEARLRRRYRKSKRKSPKVEEVLEDESDESDDSQEYQPVVVSNGLEVTDMTRLFSGLSLVPSLIMPARDRLANAPF